MGYFLISPVRKFSHKPEAILGPYLKPGMKGVDYGSAMGYFSLPMAKMVGEDGMVYCIDIQPKMLHKLNDRAVKQGLSGIIRPVLVKEGESLGFLNGLIDFVLLFAVAHEVDDQPKLFAELAAMMKPGAVLLFAEPAGHVKPAEFSQSVQLALQAGLVKAGDPQISRSMSVLLRKDEAPFL